ncbi:hypothetical protein [Streptomyces sp. CdTB01]|uniref:hypothetical protein n=1 Tax=Streptomyces sp. CdTB01 TaxID=1725411 RepID=UPI00131F3AC4|nr:hypothetical protein [Streptomyces sp. CdTB01]
MTLWLIVEERVPTRERARGVWASLYRLGGLMGPAALLASAAFAAYLVGAMVMVRVATVNVQEARKTARLRTIQMMFRPRVSKLAFDDLIHFLQVQGRVPVPQQGEIWDPEREQGERGLVNLVARDVLGETRQLRIKLLIANYDLFNEYDRAVGEAEFRKNVSYALVGLAAALSWLYSPWWALLLAVPLRLYIAGVGSERIANDVIIQAVVAGLLEPATLTGAAGLPAVPAERGA